MRIVVASLIALCSLTLPACKAQSIPQDELIRRIKLNRSLFKNWDNWPSLRERADRTNQDVVLEPTAMENLSRCNSCAAPDPENELSVKLATQKSDLVVIGRVTRNISSLTTSESFVITDSEFVIDEVWKDSSVSEPSLSHLIGREITIVTKGGVVRSDGHTIRVTPPNMAPLVRGDRYLFFLRYVPSSESYVPVGLDGYDVTQNQVQPIHKTEEMPAAALASNSTLFLQALHASSAKALAERAK